MPSTFNPLVPTGLVALKTDYQNLQNNNQQLDTTYGIDHYAFSDNSSNNGYHKKLTLIQQGSASSSLGQTILFTKSNGGSSELHMVRDGFPSTEITLTTPVFAVPVAATSGKTFLAGPSSTGAMIIQWGFVNSIVQVNAVTFSTAFPNNCYNVQLTLRNAGITSNAQSMSITSLSNSGFVANYSGGSAYNGFYWYAIGN